MLFRQLIAATTVQQASINMIEDYNEEDLDDPFLPGFRLVRVVVLGSEGVGKTSVIRRVLFGGFYVDYQPTGSPTLLTSSRMDSPNIQFEFHDGPGLATNSDPMDVFIPHGEIICLVFAVDDEESFEYMARLRERIVETKRLQNTPIIIIGNKAEEDTPRAVPFALADCLVHIDWDHLYTESSARHGQGVMEIYAAIFKVLQLEVPVSEVKAHLRRVSWRRIASVVSDKFRKIRQFFRFRE